MAATGASGAVTWRESYTPFGRERLNPAANDNSTGYTGHLKDDATGLVYMQARYYDPTIGRFLSTDPIGYQDQINQYAYVANDPLNATDPTGEFVNLLVGLAAGAALGAGLDIVVQVAEDVVKGEKITVDGKQVLRAAAVGAATGVAGPAGGAAIRAGLIGKAAAKGASAGVRAVTDTAADAVAQPAIGAIDSAISGEDPGKGALSGAAAAGTTAGFDARDINDGTPAPSPGKRAAAANIGKKIVRVVAEAITTEAASTAVEEQVDKAKETKAK